MAGAARNYLAAQVLNEGRVVNYRMLSRAVKVHSNVAKRLMYEFYASEATKKPGTLHATYLITARGQSSSFADRIPVNGHHGGDTHMQSSPLPSSEPASQNVTETSPNVITMVIANEDDVDEVKKQFEVVISIHLYSIASSPLKDLQALSACSHDVTSKYPIEDPLKAPADYLPISNPNVKRRTMRTAPPSAMSVKATATVDASSQETKPPAAVAKGPIQSTAKLQRTSSSRSAKSTRDFFNPSGKAAQKPAQPKEIVKDEPMKDASEDEQEEDFAVSKVSATQGGRRDRLAREESLRKMMEQEDEPMEDLSEDGSKPEEMEEDEPEPVNEPQPAVEEADSEEETSPKAEETVVVEGGRKRGRRRVMKKKTYQDEEGYMVTKEEPVWESFSEDEAAPEKSKSTPASSFFQPKSGKNAAPAKKGQGNIMKFFGKK